MGGWFGLRSPDRVAFDMLDGEGARASDGGREALFLREVVVRRLVVILTVVVLAAVGCDDGGASTAEQADERPPTTQAEPPSSTQAPTATTPTVAPSTTAGSTSTTQQPDPLSEELLVVGDLPAMSSDWWTVAIDEAFWKPYRTRGIVLSFCADPTMGQPDGFWKLTATPPLVNLTGGPVAIRFASNDAEIVEVLYAGNESTVATAFDELVTELEVCLDTYDPFFMFGGEQGWYWVADGYEMPSVGDESNAIQFGVRSETSDSGTWNARLAIVRSADRIVIVKSLQNEASELLTDSAYNEIVSATLQRLTS